MSRRAIMCPTRTRAKLARDGVPQQATALRKPPQNHQTRDEMDSKDDDDLKLLRSSAVLLSEIQKVLPRLLQKKVHGSSEKVVRKQAKERDLYLLISLVSHIPQLFSNREQLTYGSRLNPFKKIHSFWMPT